MCHHACPAPIAGGAGILDEEIALPGADRSLPAFLARPDRASPAPAVLVIHDIWGANDFYHDLARRLAGEGFAALLPDLFAREGPLPESTREAARARRARLDPARTQADVVAALGWLRDRPDTGATVGAVGFCMGGTLAMLAAARAPVPDAVVAFYGFPDADPTPPLAEVDRLRAPLLAFWGDQDHGVGMDTVAAYQSALAAANSRHEIVIYPDYPHGFLSFDPASPHAAGSADAWARTLAFLRAELGG